MHICSSNRCKCTNIDNSNDFWRDDAWATDKMSHVFLMLLEYLSWLSQYDRSEIKKFLQVGVSENVGINLW